MQFYPAIGLSDRQAVRRTLICKFPAARFNRRFPGKTNLRGHAFGRADTVDDLSVLTFIGRAYLPANAVIFRAQARKSLARAGRNLYFFKPGRGGLDARDAAVYELHDRPVGIVVVAVHAVGIGLSVGRERIPAFPNGRSAHLHFVKPAEVLLVHQNFACRIETAVVRQREQKEGRTRKTCRDAISVRGGIFGKHLHERGFALLRDDIEMQCKCLRGHGVARDPAVRRHVFRADCGNHLFTSAPVTIFRRVAENGGNVCCDFQIGGVKHARKELPVRPAADVILEFLPVEGEPIGIFVSAYDESVLGIRLFRREVFFYHGEIFGKEHPRTSDTASRES